MSIELFLGVGNDYYIIMCDFGDRIMRRFEVVIEGSIRAPLRLQASQKNKNNNNNNNDNNNNNKKPGLNRANRNVSFFSNIGENLSD